VISWLRARGRGCVIWALPLAPQRKLQGPLQLETGLGGVATVWERRFQPWLGRLNRTGAGLWRDLQRPLLRRS